MKKDERNQAIADGKKILRSQYDAKGNMTCWRIVELDPDTRGWKRHSHHVFTSKRKCDEFLKIMAGYDSNIIID